MSRTLRERLERFGLKVNLEAFTNIQVDGSLCSSRNCSHPLDIIPGEVFIKHKLDDKYFCQDNSALDALSELCYSLALTEEFPSDAACSMQSPWDARWAEYVQSATPGIAPKVAYEEGLLHYLEEINPSSSAWGFAMLPAPSSSPAGMSYTSLLSKFTLGFPDRLLKHKYGHLDGDTIMLPTQMVEQKTLNDFDWSLLRPEVKDILGGSREVWKLGGFVMTPPVPAAVSDSPEVRSMIGIFAETLPLHEAVEAARNM